MSAPACFNGSIPGHVPESLVYDFDMYRQPGYDADPYRVIRQLIDEAPPMFYTPRNGGHWVLARHALIFDASRSPDVFSSAKVAIPPMEVEPPQLPLTLDPPQHTPYRNALAKTFSPASVHALEGDIRSLANELIDKVIDRGRCEFVHDVAEILPVSIFMKLMGMPVDKLAKFREWASKYVTIPEQRPICGPKIIEAMTDLIRQRQQQREDDLVSRLLDAQIDGRPFTLEEVQGFCMFLVEAGLDSVTNGMSIAVWHLARDPESQGRLRADPALIPEAMEEMLRRYSFASPCRVVARDAVFNGITVKAEDRAVFLIAAGNVDDSVFPDASRFLIERENKTHMAFNVGPHRCMGSHLARLELRILYEEWLRRVPDFRLDPAAPPPHFHGGPVIGMDELNLSWQTAS